MASAKTDDNNEEPANYTPHSDQIAVLASSTFLYAFTMAVGKHAQWTKRDRSNENFKKKWGTLKKNGLNIHQIYDAEVYVCIRRRGEKYEFKSTEKALPLSDEEKVRMYLDDMGKLLLTEHGGTKASRHQCS